MFVRGVSDLFINDFGKLAVWERQNRRKSANFDEFHTDCKHHALDKI